MRRFAAGITLLLSCAAPFQLAHSADLKQILMDAIDNDSVVGAARANYLARAELVPQLRANLLPNLSISGQTQDQKRETIDTTARQQLALQGRGRYDDFNTHSWGAELRQPLIALDRWFSMRSAQALKSQAEWDLANTEQQLLLRVAEAYFNVLRAQDLLDSANSEEAAVKRQLEQVQQRFDVGLVAITDVLESQAVYDAAVVRRIQADGDHDIFFENLRTLTGNTYESLDALSAGLPVVYPAPREETSWVDEAMARNLTVKAAEQRVVSATREIKARKSAHLPTVDAVATYQHFVTGGAGSSFGDSNSRSYTLQGRIPLYSGGAVRSQVREAEYRAEESRQQLETQRRTVARDTRNFFRSLITDVVRVRARAKAIRSSESALEATQTGYEVGTRNIVDVLQAQQRLFASQFDYADSRYAYILDLLRLKQATGNLGLADIAELNNFLNTEKTIKRRPAGRLFDEAIGSGK